MLSRLYGLTEAKDRTITPAEAEKRWPDCMVAFDRDVGSVANAATLYVVDTGGDPIVREVYLAANTKGQGWWRYYPASEYREHGNIGFWQQTEKPSKQRADSHNQENVGDEYAEERFPGSIKALRTANLDPSTISFDVLNGVLIARLWDFNHTASWNKKTKSWDELPDPEMQAFAQENDGDCPVCGYSGSGQYPEQCPICNDRDED
jgi:hypothetical protein